MYNIFVIKFIITLTFLNHKDMNANKNKITWLNQLNSQTYKIIDRLILYKCKQAIKHKLYTRLPKHLLGQNAKLII